MPRTTSVQAHVLTRILHPALAVLCFALVAHAQSRPATGKTDSHAAADDTPHFGVSLAVAEFAGNKLPGVFGRDYAYPTATELDYLLARGRTLVRLPFLWERMQRDLNAPLAADELVHVRSFLRDAAQRKVRVLLDAHSYGRYHFAGEPEAQIIGTPRLPVEAFADFWGRMAAALKDEPALYGYGLMNEPHDMGDPDRWPRAAQAAVDAIRRVDPRTPIFVAGDDWSSARRWKRGPNKDLHARVHDPHNNLVFEAHCYFDKDGSGTYKKSYADEGGTPDTGVNNVKPFVEWCREKKVRGFVGEFGIPDTDTAWLVTMDRFLACLQANNISATYWSAGPWWSNYSMSIEPQGLGSGKPVQAAVDRPQMLVLRQYPG